MPRAPKEKDQIDKLIDQLDLSGITQDEMFGEGGLLQTLTTRLLNKALEAEMDHHLGYKKNSAEGNNTGNSRNGHKTKKVLTRDQEVEIEVPRDRNGKFDPVIVPKYSKRIELFNDQIISLYARGMTARDIVNNLKEIYNVDVSPALISEVTNAVMDDVNEWRRRSLEDMYAIVYLDALRINSRESGKNQNKALYIALGINMEGRKEVLGMYLSDNEGAKFWMSVLSDLKSRGVKDILFTCMDGLTGFPEAVRAVFPQTVVQLCIVHMVRNSTKFVSYKDLKAICRDLKKIYGSANEEEALDQLEAFGEIWDSKYPMIRKSWENHCNDLKEFFSYPEEIRKLIYTTNAIESLNYTLRKVTRNRNAFPDDDSVYKIMYLAINNISKKWTMPVQNWGVIINQLSIMFGDRVKL